MKCQDLFSPKNVKKKKKKKKKKIKMLSTKILSGALLIIHIYNQILSQNRYKLGASMICVQDFHF